MTLRFRAIVIFFLGTPHRRDRIRYSERKTLFVACNFLALPPGALKDTPEIVIRLTDYYLWYS